MPSGASQVGSRTLLALASWRARAVGDDPVELAPARLARRLLPGVDARRPVLERDLHLPGPDLLERPRHRRPGPDRHAALGCGDRMRAELDLPQPMGRPARGVERLLAHQIGQDRAGLLARVRLDVDALEEVAVGRERVDLALRRRARDRQRRQDLRRTVLEADDLRHLAEPRQVGRPEVEHRHPMAVDPALDVDHEFARRSPRSPSRRPTRRLRPR